MKDLLRAVLWAAFTCLLALRAGLAQDVTLSSPDGAVEVTGNLLGFDGEFYRVDTIYGELTLDGSGVVCTGPGCPNLTDFVAEITISGSAQIGEVMVPALLEGFALREGYDVQRIALSNIDRQIIFMRSQSQTPAARITVRASSSDEGFADLLANEADIVMSLREIRPEEQQNALAAGFGDLTDQHRSRVLALDAIVPVVAPGHPVRAISQDDLVRVLTGKITNWQDLGGADARINVLLPDPITGLGQALEDRVLQSSDQPVLPDHDTFLSSDALATAVLTDPFSLGLTSHSDMGRAQPLALTGPCGFALRASRLTLKTEDFPLTQPLFLYMPARRLPKIARDFLTFTESSAAQIIIRRVGFIDQAPEEISIAEQGARFANAIVSAGPETSLEELQRMTRTLYPMRRLTTSFRFEPGSARLDAQSRSNVVQLARALEAGRYDARRLLFAGFSDGEGAARANRDIALKRAEAVRRAVIEMAATAQLDRMQMDVDAFGEALPMACDDSAWGRQTNRRVEVWVR